MQEHILSHSKKSCPRFSLGISASFHGRDGLRAVPNLAERFKSVLVKGGEALPLWLLISSSTRSGPVCVLTPRIIVTVGTPRLLPRVLALPVKGSEPSWVSRKPSPGTNSVASIESTSL